MPIDCRAASHQSLCQWTDWLGLQPVDVEVLRPRSRRELVDHLSRSRAPERLRLRAAGSGHSTSVVAQPRDGAHVVQLEDLKLDFEDRATNWLLPAHRHRRLVRVSAGMTIAELNARLAQDGLALPNMGSYDRQTIAGAVSTSTHGSGLVTGPLCDLVRSVELVSVVPEATTGRPTVASFRVEPSVGITDRAAFDAAREEHGMTLLSDDDTFFSVVVGLGCMGVMVAFTLEVEETFWIEERCTFERWTDVRGRLPQEVGAWDYYDLVVTALPGRGGEHGCLVTRRARIPPKDLPPPERDDDRARSVRERFRRYRENPRAKVSRYLSRLASAHPKWANGLTAASLRREAEARPNDGAHPWSSRSDKVLRTSLGDWVLATSAEVAVPLERSVDAVDRAIHHLGWLHDRGYHHGSPLGVRFQDASRHFLSPQFGRRTCTVEAPVLMGMRRRRDDDTIESARHAAELMLHRFERELQAHPLDGRPHWGQRNTMTLGEATLQYPRFATWRSLLERFNAFGTHDNALTDGLGLSRPR